jgi:flagellar biosynthesis protein FlhF
MSTAAYDTATHPAAPRRAAPRQAAAHDDSWLDSWEAGRDPGDPNPQGSVPGYFAPRIYRGRSIDELIPTIVAELGEDAVVIRHHRGLTGGFAGFFQRSFVEIEARRGDPGGSLLDRYDEEDAAPALPGDVAPALPGEFEDDRAPVAPPKPLGWDGPTEVWATNPFAAALAEAEAAVRAAEPAVPPDLDAALAEALAEAEEAEAPEEIVAAAPPDLYAEPVAATPPAEVATLPDRHSTSPDAIHREVESPAPQSAAPPSVRDEIERTLRGVGIGEAFVQELIEAASAHVLPLMPPGTSLGQAVHTALTQMIPASAPLPARGGAIAVVGAGGSGKSACCAALVEAYRAHSALPATCVTIPPGIPPGEPALYEGRDGGVLLLDTPPVSCADPGSISALAELLEQVRPERVVLALPATLGATPAAQLLEALDPLRPDALAITHADETDQLGVAVQTACTFGLAPVHLLARAEHGCGDARPGAQVPEAIFPRTRIPATLGSAWALTWIDPFLLADRLLPLR